MYKGSGIFELTKKRFAPKKNIWNTKAKLD